MIHLKGFFLIKNFQRIYIYIYIYYYIISIRIRICHVVFKCIFKNLILVGQHASHVICVITQCVSPTQGGGSSTATEYTVRVPKWVSACPSVYSAVSRSSVSLCVMCCVCLCMVTCVVCVCVFVCGDVCCVALGTPVRSTASWPSTPGTKWTAPPGLRWVLLGQEQRQRTQLPDRRTSPVPVPLLLYDDFICSSVHLSNHISTFSYFQMLSLL